MKSFLFTILFFVSAPLFSQRYLTFVYSQIDSVIGATYGNASNFMSVNQNLVFDFYSPTADTSQKRPLIIYIHGGGFNTGVRSYPSVKLFCRKMAMKGYAVATIDYRLDPNFQLYNSNTNRRAMTDAMHDAKQAIRYFKANAALYKLDTNKVFIGGESAGAITSMMASYVDKQPEMNVYPMANPNNPIGSTSNSGFSNSVKATLCLCGMILDTLAIENASNPPVLWTHGSADTYIPVSLAFNVVLRAAHIGLPIQTKLYQGATHCPWYFGNPNWQTYLDSTINDVTSFLYPKVVTGFVGVKQLQNEEFNITVFPNPVANEVNFDFGKMYSSVSITLIAMDGAIKKYWDLKNTKQESISLENFKDGLYIFKIGLDNETVLTKKISILKN
jgi:acetyl esterase/lipase